MRSVQNINITQLYNETCSKCHGLKGEGGGAGTKSLNTKEKFDQKFDKPFFDAIKNGVPEAGMESYGQTMNDQTIWALTVHIRELQARALRDESGSVRPGESGIAKTSLHDYKIEDVITKDVRTPWGIDWLPNGDMLITQRPGGVKLFSKGKLEDIAGIPESVEIGQGGMMEVAVHPQYKQNGWIYLAFTAPAKEGGNGGMTKIVRGKLTTSGGPKWSSEQTIFECDPSTYNRSGVHFGSRIVFDGKGHIFFSIGERGNGNLAQDLSKPNGKIFRVKDDGSIPSDNPFLTKPDVIKAIWSFGHRNPQGLVMDLNGNLWDTEHAPRGGDEVNLIQKGANYGWPIVSYGINYNDSPLATPWNPGVGGVVQPIFRWLPSTGACGLDVAKGPMFPKWKGDLLAGGLAGNNVDRIRVDKQGKFVEREEILHGLGRVRDVAVGPDGAVYIALNQPDKIIKMVQAQ